MNPIDATDIEGGIPTHDADLRLVILTDTRDAEISLDRGPLVAASEIAAPVTPSAPLLPASG